MAKLAFLILTHSDPIHLRKLVDSLPPSDIFIHVDAKVDLSEFKLMVFNKSVSFVEPRVSVAWAGISMIDATNSLMNFAFKSSDANHFILLSGSCYPIKRNVELLKFFGDSNISNIKFFDMRSSPEHYMKHVVKCWFKEPFIRTKTKSLIFTDKAIRRALDLLRLKNKWDKNIVPYFGSQWFSLSRDALEYVLKYQQENAGYYEMNKRTFAPDEHYYHTIIGNSKFAKESTGVQPFEGRGTYRMANFHIIDPSLSKWFCLSDFDSIKNSERIFVRKVRTLDGSDLLDKIDSLLSDSNSTYKQE